MARTNRTKVKRRPIWWGMNNERILLTVAEVAQLTGFSEGTLRHWISEGRIPVIRISARCVRFRRSDVDAWIAERLIRPVGDSVSARSSPAQKEGERKRTLSGADPKEKSQ